MVYQILISIKNILGKTVISATVGGYFIALTTVSAPRSTARLLPTAADLLGESHCGSGWVAAACAVAAIAVGEPPRLPLSLNNGKDEFGEKSQCRQLTY